MMENQEVQQDPAEDGETRNEVKWPDFGMVGAKTIEIYQRQAQIAEGVWSYFSIYSGILVALSLVLLLLGQPLEVQRIVPSPGYWLVLAVAYLALAVGAFRTLSFAMRALNDFRGLAIRHTGREFHGSKVGQAQRLFVALGLLVLIIYGYAVFRTYQMESPTEDMKPLAADMADPAAATEGR